MKRKRFEGGYIRGGQQTLWMSRQDIVEALAHLFKTKADVREIMREARAWERECLRHSA